MQEQISEILIYIKGALKYKWVAILVAWLICVGGWTFVMRLPDQYVSVAKVHVDSSTMLQPLLKGITVQQDARVLVNIMKKLMFTTPNLDKIIQLSKLDFLIQNEIQRVKLYKEMKDDIKISGGKRDGIFEISYVSKDPRLAKNVVTAVLTVFSEQTQQSTLNDVNSSQRFIAQQIRESEVRLRNAEKALEAFKRANFGLLPEQGSGQMAKLYASKEELESAKLLLRESISKRNVLSRQMQDVIDSGDAWKSSNSILQLSPEDEMIKDLRQRKAELLLKYTENHPAVTAIDITLRESIRRKEQNKKKSKDSALPSADAMANPYVQQLKIALNEADAEVASNNARVSILQQRIKNFKKQLDLRLSVETEMMNLNRDYETIKKNYQTLLGRREQARMSEKVDTEAVTIKFKIADPPNKPLTPSGPNRLLLLTVVLIGGLGVGFGLAFLLYFIKPTYMTIRQLQTVTGLPVLGFVSKQILDGPLVDKSFYRFALISASLVFVYIGFMGFEYLRMQHLNPSGLVRKIF
jgi:protein tyrosine kinase modulator